MKVHFMADDPTIVCRLGGDIERADIAVLCDRLRTVLECERAESVVCDVAATTRSDAVLVDALARLQLVARGMGSEVRLRHARLELLDLMDLMGLAECLRSES